MYHLLKQQAQLGNVITMIDFYSKKNDDKKNNDVLYNNAIARLMIR